MSNKELNKIEEIEQLKDRMDKKKELVDELIELHQIWKEQIERHKFILDTLGMWIEQGNEDMIDYWNERKEQSKELIRQFRNEIYKGRSINQ